MGLDLVAGHRAWPKQTGGTVEEGNDGGFQAEGAWTAIKGFGGVGAGLLDGVGEGGGARGAGAIGRGRGDGAAERGQDGAGERVGGRADGDAVQTGAGEIADRGSIDGGRDDGQRPGPEGARQAPGALVKGGQGGRRPRRRRGGRSGD